jgi:hypothetical protein
VDDIGNGLQIDYGGQAIKRTTRMAAGGEQIGGDRIRKQYIQQHLSLTDQDFRLFEVPTHYEFHPVDAAAATLTAGDFAASRGFIGNFKKRNRLSSRGSV